MTFYIVGRLYMSGWIPMCEDIEKIYPQIRLTLLNMNAEKIVDRCSFFEISPDMFKTIQAIAAKYHMVIKRGRPRQMINMDNKVVINGPDNMIDLPVLKDVSSEKIFHCQNKDIKCSKCDKWSIMTIMKQDLEWYCSKCIASEKGPSL